MTELYKRRREPFPTKIGLKEDQYVKIEDSKYYMSIYPTKSDKTTFDIDPKFNM